MVRKSAAILCLIFSMVGYAGEIFVSPGGSDGAEGSRAAPLRTLKKALGKAGEGDTITLRRGTYDGNVTIGTHKLTLQSQPGERAVIRAGKKGTNVIINWRDHVVLRNLDFQGGDGYGVDFNKAKHALMEGCRVYEVKGEIVKVSPGSNHVTIRSCEIFNNFKAAAEGIDAVSVDHLTVQDCFIHDVGKTGAYSKGGSRWCVYERNLIMRCGLNEGNKGCGILIGQAGGTANNPFKGQKDVWQNAHSVVRNNIIVDIEGAGFGAWKALEPKFLNNTLVNVAKSDRAGVIILGGSKDVMIVNNIVKVGSNRHLLWIYRDGLKGALVMDNNCYSGGSRMFWDERPGGGTFRIEQWRQKYGIDGASFVAEPGLDANYHLTPESPCLGKGKKIADVGDDYEGARRPRLYSIGADEIQAHVLPVPPPKGWVGTGGGKGAARVPSLPVERPEVIITDEGAAVAAEKPPEARASALTRTEFVAGGEGYGELGIVSYGDGTIQDTMLKDDGRPDFAREDDGMRNFGTLAASNGADGRWRFPLIKFDITEIPAKAERIEATLRLHCLSVRGTGSVTAYPLKKEWRLEKACFNYRDAGKWWNEGDRPFDPSEGSSDYYSDLGVKSEALVAGRSAKWDISSIVRKWVKGEMANNGLVLMADEKGGEANFCSVNHKGAGGRPDVMVGIWLPTEGYLGTPGGGLPAPISVTKPKGGETFKPGEEVTIKWEPRGVESDVALALRDFESRKETPIHTLPNTGEFLWEVEDPGKTGEYQIVIGWKEKGKTRTALSCRFTIVSAKAAVKPAPGPVAVPAGEVEIQADRTTTVLLLVVAGVVLVVGVLLVSSAMRKGRGGKRTYHRRRDDDDA